MKRTLLATAILLAYSSVSGATTFTIVPKHNSVYNQNINITNGNDYGIFLGDNRTSTFTGEQITLIQNVNGTNATGIYTRNFGKLTLGDRTKSNVKIHVTDTNNSKATYPWAVWVDSDQAKQNGGQVTIQGKSVDLQVTGDASDDMTVVHVATNSLTNPNRSKLTIDADQINIVANKVSGTGGSGSNGFAVMSAGELYVKGNLSVTADHAILARGDSIIRINESGKDKVVLNGDIVFDYDGPTSATKVDSDVLVNLSTPDSVWNGNLKCTFNELLDTKKQETPNILEVKNMKLGLSNGATWTPTEVANKETSVQTNKGDGTTGTQNVALNQLTLNGGVVNVTNDKINVIVEKVTGTGGTINVATDLAAPKDQQTGSFKVQNGTQATQLNVVLKDKQMTRALTSDEVAPTQASELIKDIGGSQVKTTTDVVEGMYKPGYGVNNQGAVTSHGPNTVMQAGLDLVASTPLALNRILMNDLRKRMGDLRSSEGTSGAWARYDGGRLSGPLGLENDFNTIQVGVDTQPTNDPLRFGVSFSYTKSDTDYARGSADMDAYSLAAYGVWFGEQGQFIDVVARMADAKTDVTIDGSKTGSVDNLALSLSSEFGWRFDVLNSFYVEPQIEGTYTYVDAEHLALSDGSQYSYDATDSFLGRAGLAFGMKCPNQRGNVYARVSAVHEFLGDKAVTGIDGTIHKIEGKDTWLEYGIGANFNVTPSTYFWADLERTSGSDLEQDYRATVGVRYAW